MFIETKTERDPSSGRSGTTPFNGGRSANEIMPPLWGFEFYPDIFYKHGAPLALGKGPRSAVPGPPPQSISEILPTNAQRLDPIASDKLQNTVKLPYITHVAYATWFM